MQPSSEVSAAVTFLAQVPHVIPETGMSSFSPVTVNPVDARAVWTFDLSVLSWS